MGLELDALTREELEAGIVEAIDSGRRRVVGHQNLHGLAVARREPVMGRFASQADVVFLDGMALVAMARGLGYQLSRRHRVTYADWIDPLMALAGRQGWRVFHLGGRDGVGERAAASLVSRHPGLDLLTVPGHLDAESTAQVVDRIRAEKPQLLLVGMGMPRQERFVLDHLEELPRAAILTCGACMDYVAGEIPTPPRWSGRIGLEWLFRWAAEPRRLSGRYFVEPWPLAVRYLREWRHRRAGGHRDGDEDG